MIYRGARPARASTLAFLASLLLVSIHYRGSTSPSAFLTSRHGQLSRRELTRSGLVVLGEAMAMQLKPSSAVTMQMSEAEKCVRAGVLEIIKADSLIGPSLLRLAFHDAATRRRGDGKSQGPNGSIRFELARNENVGPSLKSALDSLQSVVGRCSVSWADAIAIGGAAAVEASGGPVIQVGIGRKDATEADVEGRLPDGTLTAGAIRDYFIQLGFSDEELVALIGGHTLGRWTSLIGVDSNCLKNDKEFWTCSRDQGKRLPFTEHPTSFDSEYFSAVSEFGRRQKLPKPTKRFKDQSPEEKFSTKSPLNLLPSDVGLLYDPQLKAVVERFAADKAAFFTAFSRAYVKLVA